MLARLACAVALALLAIGCGGARARAESAANDGRVEEYVLTTSDDTFGSVTVSAGQPTQMMIDRELRTVLALEIRIANNSDEPVLMRASAITLTATLIDGSVVVAEPISRSSEQVADDEAEVRARYALPVPCEPGDVSAVVVSWEIEREGQRLQQVTALKLNDDDGALYPPGVVIPRAPAYVHHDDRWPYLHDEHHSSPLLIVPQQVGPGGPHGAWPSVPSWPHSGGTHGSHGYGAGSHSPGGHHP